jgi:CheY-like chemotaxis protein
LEIEKSYSTDMIHILLVEDNEGDILLTTEALKDAKIRNSVAITRDGWEAIQYLEKEDGYAHAKTPDLILLDINLPKLNGQEVLKKIKTNDRFKHIPVIVLTTSSSEQDINISYSNHANSYITKPVEAGDFIQVILTIEHFWINIVKLPKKLK